MSEPMNRKVESLALQQSAPYIKDAQYLIEHFGSQELKSHLNYENYKRREFAISYVLYVSNYELGNIKNDWAVDSTEVNDAKEERVKSYRTREIAGLLEITEADLLSGAKLPF